jgi:hypothetical protein
MNLNIHLIKQKPQLEHVLLTFRDEANKLDSVRFD